MKIKAEEYICLDGSNPYKAWFDNLDSQAAAKIVVAKLRLELGNTSNVKWFDGIGEYVINWGPGYRIYLVKGGGTKRGQQKDIDRAKALLQEYKMRKKAKPTASKTEKSKR